MKTPINKLIAFSLAFVIFATSSMFSLAQNKLVGELVVTQNSPEGFVLVNGERAVSGRSITSSSDISTSPQASARILLPQTGTILASPNSKLNLTFVNSSVSGDFLAGEITIETAPNTTVNLFTPDGTITIPNRNQINIFKVSIENGKTRVNTLSGQIMFNIVLVSAGEFYPLSPNGETPSDSDSSGGINPLLIVGILGAAAGVALIALTTSSNNNDTPVVSPTR